MSYLGAMLHDQRAKLGYSVDAMAAMLGISGGMVSLVENGKRKPGSARLLRLIATAYKIDYAVAVELHVQDIREGLFRE